MPGGLEAMKVALRVLTALTEKREPAFEDVEALRQYVPTATAESIDELACDVIQQALRKRADGRKAGGA
jgi:hypothetical protein